MTNKERYIKSFSGVEPSVEIKERIINMTNSKKKTSFKPLVITFAILMLLAMAMFTANAATDGELGEKISETSKEIGEKIVVFFNGEEIPVETKKTVKTDENGKSIVSVAINLPDIVNSETDDEVVFELDSLMNDVGEVIIGEYDENGEVDSFKYEITCDTE